ncbi:hypothetical protein AKO1_012650 [Acrasis kona]|uniref:Uncharacterized protein n=1 Tax=Acrasis kona TaxID=1008807 RepID=A0AAW2YWX6_9EUKA
MRLNNFVDVFNELRTGTLSKSQVSKFLIERSKATKRPLFILEDQSGEQDDSEIMKTVIENSPASCLYNPPPPSPDVLEVPDATQLAPQIPILNYDDISHLDNHFPDLIDGRFVSSEFQTVILNHMQAVRDFTGHKNGVIVLATGLGKTVLVILDIEREISKHKEKLNKKVYCNMIVKQPSQPGAKRRLLFVKPNTPAKDKFNFRLLFLVHSKQIRDEASRKFKQHFGKLDYRKESFLVVDESITTFDRIPKNIVDTCTHCIVDEVHHLLAHTYNRVHETLSKSSCMKYMLGITATLTHRHDPSGDGIKAMFSNVLYIDLPWTLAKTLGCFPNVEYLECLDTLTRDKDVPTYSQLYKEFTQHKNVNIFLSRLEKSLSSLGMSSDEQVKSKLTSAYIVQTLLNYCAARVDCGLPQKKKILIFADSITKADSIAELINKQNRVPMTASSVHYKVGKRCDQIFDNFRNGKLTVLVNVMMINEGYDMPNIDCVVMCRLTESEIVFTQQMGRGLRKDHSNPDKEVCIIDLALNLRRRWKRISEDLDKSDLSNLICSFWSIDNFCDTPVESDFEKNKNRII